MTEPNPADVTLADRMKAEVWRFIECMHCSQYEGDFVSDLAEDFAAHRIASANEAADEIERLRAALQNVQIEAEREKGSWVHLKRVIALNCRAALSQESADVATTSHQL